MKNSYAVHVCSILASLFAFVLVGLLGPGACWGQSSQMFRFDGGDTTYAFGVNERGELQPIYWGGRLGSHDVMVAPH